MLPIFSAILCLQEMAVKNILKVLSFPAQFCQYLASAIFVKKPERIRALSFITDLCLQVQRLAKVRLRSHLAWTQQIIPKQVQEPTAHHTM